MPGAEVVVHDRAHAVGPLTRRSAATSTARTCAPMSAPKESQALHLKARIVRLNARIRRATAARKGHRLRQRPVDRARDSSGACSTWRVRPPPLNAVIRKSVLSITSQNRATEPGKTAGPHTGHAVSLTRHAPKDTAIHAHRANPRPYCSMKRSQRRPREKLLCFRRRPLWSPAMRTIIASLMFLAAVLGLSGSAFALDKENTLYIDLKDGRVVIEMLPKVSSTSSRSRGSRAKQVRRPRLPPRDPGLHGPDRRPEGTGRGGMGSCCAEFSKERSRRHGRHGPHQRSQQRRAFFICFAI